MVDQAPVTSFCVRVCALILMLGLIGCNGGEDTEALEQAVQGTWSVDVDATIAAVLADENASESDKKQAANMPDAARKMMAGMTLTVTEDRLSIDTGRGVEAMGWEVLAPGEGELVIAVEKDGAKKNATMGLTDTGHLHVVTDEGRGDLDKLRWSRTDSP